MCRRRKSSFQMVRHHPHLLLTQTSRPLHPIASQRISPPFSSRKRKQSAPSVGVDSISLLTAVVPICHPTMLLTALKRPGIWLTFVPSDAVTLSKSPLSSPPTSHTSITLPSCPLMLAQLSMPKSAPPYVARGLRIGRPGSLLVAVGPHPFKSSAVCN